MVFQETNFSGVLEIQLEPIGDERGFFMRTYDKKLFGEHGIDRDWVQENHSFNTKRGTVRGLHFQYPPHAEGKLVRVLNGEAFFAFVDLRKRSPSFGKWGSTVLSAENKKILFTPRGFALGVCTLSDNCAFFYKTDNYYAPESAETIRWDDPDIGIVWPIRSPSSLSEKDRNGKSFKDFLGTRGALEV